ncbi:MAG: YeeE/YedE thiosulfate transporter family protein [Dissulfuribacterales bacterium]
MSIGEKFNEVYDSFFKKTWSPMTGGILLAFLAILMVEWKRPWGIVGGIRNWADWFFYGIGFYTEMPDHPLYHSGSMMDMGLLAGAWISAVLAREFAFRVPPMLEIWKGLIAGIFMGLGATLAFGCNVGGFYSAIQNLSASGFTMMIGLIAGVVVGLKYIYWEMEHFTPGPAGPTFLGNLPPFLGWVAIIGLIAAGYAYTSSEVEGAKLMPGYLLIGAGIGFVFHRSRLCMVNGFREPFMTGEAAMGKAVAVSIILGALGIGLLKFTGLRGTDLYVETAFGWGSLVGGFIFGAAMVVAGGCGSGSLWRVAEGQIKLWVVIISFALSNSLFRHWFEANEWMGKLGSAVFLPDILGYGGTFMLVIAAMFIWYLVIDWNEDSNALVIEM